MSEPESTTDVNRRCSRCGAAVTRRFVRVFGASDRVHGCLDCLTRQRLADGDAAKHVGGNRVGSDWR